MSPVGGWAEDRFEVVQRSISRLYRWGRKGEEDKVSRRLRSREGEDESPVVVCDTPR